MSVHLDEPRPSPEPDDEDLWAAAMREAFAGDGDEDPARMESAVLLQRSRVRLADGREPQAEPDALGLSGHRLGRYIVEAEIAAGGVGLIYRGRDEDLGREVAIKIIRRDLAGELDLVRRFVEEAQVGGQLQHPGIVPVYDFGLDHQHRPWFAMPLVEGRTFAELLRERSTATRDRGRDLRILADVAGAVGHAHERGVVHRDLKPHNVIVGRFGQVQVMDWGFAKVLGGDPEDEDMRRRVQTLRGEADATMSRHGDVYGTPHYMAPEQARGNIAAIDRRSDVYALGSMLVEVLTGEPPHGLRMPAEQAMRIAEGGAQEAAERRLAATAEAVDPELAALALRCLEIDPERRPKDAGEIASALESWRDRTEERADRARIEAAEARGRAQEETKARRLTLTLAGLAGAIILAGSLAFLAHRRAVGDGQQEAAVALNRARFLAADESWDAAHQALSGSAFRHATREQEAERRALAKDLDRWRAGARLRERLRRIRIDAVTASDETHADVRRDFAEAFGAAGVVVGAGTRPSEVPHRTENRVAISRALDAWSRMLDDEDPDSGRRRGELLELARALDPAPDRDPLRAAWIRDTLTEAQLTPRSEDIASIDAITLDLQAALLQSRGRTAEAAEILRAATVHHPEDIWLNLRLAAVLAADDDSQEEAQRHLTMALVRAPNSEGLRRRLARLHARRGDAAAVRRMFEAEAGQNDPDIDLLFAYADSLLEQGQTAQAAPLLEDLERRLPDDERIRRRRQDDRRPRPRPGAGAGPGGLGGPGGMRGPGPGRFSAERFALLSEEFELGIIDGRAILDLVNDLIDLGDPDAALGVLAEDDALHPPRGRLRQAVLRTRAHLETGAFAKARAALEAMTEIADDRGPPGRRDGPPRGPQNALKDEITRSESLAALAGDVGERGLAAFGPQGTSRERRGLFQFLRRTGRYVLAAELLEQEGVLEEIGQGAMGRGLRDAAAIGRLLGGERGRALITAADRLYRERFGDQAWAGDLWKLDRRLGAAERK